MKLLEYFTDWLNTNAEKKLFEEMWNKEFSAGLSLETNECVPHHRKMAYDIYLMEKKIVELEERIENLGV